jgi:predicted hydrocarbon binding protein
MVVTSKNAIVTPKREPAFKLEHSLKQKYPKKHAHYSFEDFFHFQSDTGAVTDWNEARNIFTSEDFIIGLIEGLEEEVGSASAVVMYSIGYQWGIRDAKFFQHWFEKEYEKNIREVNTMFMLEAWWWPFTTQGWGNWEVDMSEHKNGFMFVNIFDSAVARTLGDIGKPVCHIYAGLFAGFFSDLVKKSLSCIEIQCYSMGETYCKFLMGRQDRIDAAAFWQNEGATARDIEKRLRNGERLG